MITYKIPGDIKYRISRKGDSCFQPQYKKGKKWKNCTYPYHDGRSGDITQCNKSFNTLEEAEVYVDNLVKKNANEIYYKETWK